MGILREASKGSLNRHLNVSVLNALCGGWVGNAFNLLLRTVSTSHGVQILQLFYQLRQIHDHVEGTGLRVSFCGDDMTQFRRCLAASFFLNVAAQNESGDYRAKGYDELVKIHPSSTR